jgi:hypothetical protein
MNHLSSKIVSWIAQLVAIAIIGHFTQLGWQGERFRLGVLAVIV